MLFDSLIVINDFMYHNGNLSLSFFSFLFGEN